MCVYAFQGNAIVAFKRFTDTVINALASTRLEIEDEGIADGLLNSVFDALVMFAGRAVLESGKASRYSRIMIVREAIYTK